MTSTPVPSSTDPASVGVPQTTGPLTDPAELVALLGRFVACVVMFILTIAAFVKHATLIGVGIAIFSLFYQRATLRMWRRLRDERMAAEAARAGMTQSASPEVMQP
jgi:hypothetical protein